MCGISYRSSNNFFMNRQDIREVIGPDEISNFRTLSRRARMIDLHYTNTMAVNIILTQR